MLNGEVGAVSELENEACLMAGSSTKVIYGDKETTYGAAHKTVNIVSEGGLAFTNSPKLRSGEYVPTIESMKLTTTSDYMVWGYTDAPTLSVIQSVKSVK